jgi:methionine biosynthesis protein MetW
VLASVKNGVNVIQGDIETGLAWFADNSFDFVILSQTLQAMRNAESVMKEMLRVGREGIVSFPNFGYWSIASTSCAATCRCRRACPTRGGTPPTSTCAP